MAELLTVESSEESKNKPPFSIGFDAKRALYNRSGLGNYSRSLIYALAKEHPENSYLLFSSVGKNRIRLEQEERFNLIEPEAAIFRLFGSLWRTKYITKDIKRLNPAIFHGLSHELPVGIEKTGVRSVLTVHDLIFLRFPGFYKKIDAAIYRRKLMHASMVSDHIIAISDQTRNDLIELMQVPSEKISVIHQGCNPQFLKKESKDFFEKVRLKYSLPREYLLYVGTVEERKNLLGILRALHIRNINIPLVVVGRKAEPYIKKVYKYISDNKLKNILFPENITNDELPAVYQNAISLVYPSFYEGFGIPVLEALVSGTPVITSKGGCFSEAGGPGSIYVDPYKAEEIGDAIIRVVNDNSLRNMMIETGEEYANNFSDQNIVEKYMKVYRSLLK